jgi:hypothetical protein
MSIVGESMKESGESEGRRRGEEDGREGINGEE